MAKKRTREIRQHAPSQRRHRVSVNHILLPFDFSIHSKNALRYAVLMAKEFDASLHLVYVVEPTLYPADLGFGQVVLPEVEDDLVEEGEKQLLSIIKDHIGKDVQATSVVRRGKPHQEILQEAEERKIDLIIVPTHGHTGVEHILFGSTAERIVRNAKCPVMTLRPEVLG